MLKSVLTLFAVLALSACGSSSQTASSPSPSATAQPTPTPTVDVANLDPCQLVTQQEASQLAVSNFGPGKPEVVSAQTKSCTYGFQTTNVFMVEVAVAPDAATAQAQWVQTEAEAHDGLQKLLAEEGATVTANVSDISLSGADKAATAAGTGDIGGHPINGSVIYVLKGRVFFMLADVVLDKKAPTAAQMEQQAQIVLTRV